MKRTSSTLALALFLCAVASAAITNIPTTLTVNATLSTDFKTFVVDGTANFTGSIGNGRALSETKETTAAAFTIKLTAGGTLTGDLSVPVSLLVGSSDTGLAGEIVMPLTELVVRRFKSTTPGPM